MGVTLCLILHPTLQPLLSVILQSAEASNCLLKTLLFYLFIFSLCIPQESYKSLCSSCFLCKSKDELELIKRKLRGHTEVLGSVKGGGSSSGAGIVAVERNVELYRHTHTPHLGSI